MRLKLQSFITPLFLVFLLFCASTPANAQLRDTTVYDYNTNGSSGCLICGSNYDCFTSKQHLLIGNGSPGRLTKIVVKIYHTSCGSGNFYAMMNGDTLGVISPAYSCQCNSCTVDTISADFNLLGSYQYNDTNFLTFSGIQLCADRIVVIRTYSSTATNDAAMYSIDSPYRVCPGARNIVVTIGNTGRNRIDSVKVNWTYNGVTQTTYRHNSVLDTIGGSGSNKARITLGSKTLVAGRRDTLKVWTSLPNGATDTATRNDTLIAYIKPSLGDTLTVGGSNPDYGSVQAAINDLQANGVCGPVVINIRPGSYNEQLIIGPIPGTDSVKTVTFRSSTGDSSDVTIYYASFASGTNYTVQLKNAAHVKFAQLTLEALGSTYGRVVDIGGTFLNLSFMNCRISGSTVSTTSTNHALFMANSLTGNTSRKIQIDKCEFKSGSTGFYWTTSNTVSDLSITGSNFIDQYYSNIFCYYFSKVQISGNLLSRENTAYTSGYGIYFYNNRNITVMGNRILQPNGASGAIYTDNVNRTGSFRNLIANNFLVAGKAAYVDAYAWNSYYSYYIDFYNNSTYSNTFYSGYSNLYIYNGSNIRVRNNSVSQNGTGNIMYVSYSGTKNIEASDRNNFYSPTAPTFYYNTTISGLAGWKSSTSLDSASTFGNPNYKTTLNLHAYSSDMNRNATPDARITKDIDGENRSSTNPDIGADEFSLVPADAGIAGIFPYKADSVCVRVILKNHGEDTLNSVQVRWSINGTAKTTYNWSGNLLSGDTAELCIGMHRFLTNTNYNVKVWTSSPNSVTDTMNFNDTATRSGKPALSGVYTIGGTTPDFSTFTAAVSAMTDGGIIDSVLFKVRNGTYNERIAIPAIQGATRKNAIVFESQNKDSSLVTLSFGTSYSAYEVVYLDAAQWVTFRHMTIKSTSSSTATRAVTLDNGTSNVDFFHCVLESASTTNTNDYYNCLVYNDQSGLNISFAGNRFKNGSVAMYTYGNTNLSLTGNLLEDAYYAGLYVDRSTNFTFRDNIIRSNSAYSGHYGLYIYQLYGTNRISGNRISGPDKSEYAGVYIQYLEANNSTDSSYIFNNFINVGGDNAEYALYIYSTENAYITNNNVHQHGTRSGAIGARLVYPYYSKILNNIFVNSKGGLAARIQSPYQTVHDHNNYYSTGSTLTEINSNSYSDLASMLADGIDSNSRSVDPGFISNSDLHVEQVNLNARAKKLHFVTRDIDGETRSATPDIGADEFVPVTRDAGVTGFISPAGAIIPDTVQIKVIVTNRGLDTLTSVRVHCKINSDTFAIVTLNDTLGSGDTAQVIIGNYIFKRDSVNNLTAWTSQPNNLTDQKKSNDTFRIKNKKTAMSGVYTIGGTTPDFTTFKAAIQAMKEAGISGGVRFRVRSGTYTEQLVLTPIDGANQPGSVIFESSNLDSTSVTLQYNSTFSDTNYVVFFEGASNITFRNLTIMSLNSSNGVVFRFEENASYNKLNNNRIKNSTSNTTSSSMALVGSFNSNTTEQYNEFDRNVFEGGSYGVYWYGYGPPNYRESGTRITNNTFLNQFYNPVALIYQDGPVVDFNTISSTSTYSDFMAIRGEQLYNKVRITRNNIKRPDYGRYGIYIYSGYGNGDTILVANNMVNLGGSGDVYGFYMYNVNRGHFINNTIRLGTSTNSSSIGMYLESGSSQNVLNNIIENTGAGVAINIYNSSAIQKSDKNNFRSSGSNLARRNNIYYTDLASFRSASGTDANSLSINPLFTGTTNLHIREIGLNAKADRYTGLTTDFEGDLRDSTPDIGADEFDPPALDAGISDIITPKTPFLPDTQFVKVVLKNFGMNSISSVNIGWVFNGTAQTSYSWSGSLASNDTVHVILGTKNFDPDSAYSLKAWTSLPNSYNDTVNYNDTASAVNQYPALSGTYTIGGASPDFNTFTDAVDAMKRGGIIGSVLFNVRNGTYNEQLDIPAITGAAERNDIVFQSENLDSTLVTLTNSAGSSNNYTVRLNGARGITFRKMTVSAVNSTYATVFYLENGATLTSLENNILEGVSSTGSGANHAIVYSTITNSRNNDNNHFTSNVFKNGAYGIYAYGYNNGVYDKNIKVHNNTFETPYYNAIFLNYTDTPAVTSNKITMGTYQYGFGVRLEVARGTMNISGNNIILPSGYMGLYLYSCNSYSSRPSIVSNNMISLLGQYDAYGIYNYSGSYINFYNNNVRVASTYTSSYAIQHSSSNNIRSVNNIFDHTGSGYALYTSSTGTIVESNHNCYRTNGSYLAYWGGDRSDLAALKSANSKDGNSISVDPFFVSGTDLHVRAVDLNKAGKSLSDVKKDFDGNKRDSLTPDIGADEFEIPSPNDAGISAYGGPNAPFASGSRTVRVILNNFGSDTLKNATIKWTMNGVSQTNYSWSGAIKSGGSDTVSIGSFSFTGGVNYTLRAWPTSPNGVTDTLNYNDTLTKSNIYSGLDGIYTIGGSLPDFNTFNDARNALMLGGVLDTVIFKVRNGTYNEQVQILQYPGSSVSRPVTFTSESGDSSKVTLQYSAPNYNNNYIFSLKGADNITISKMTMSATNSYYSTVVSIDNGAANNRILNNRILMSLSYYNGVGVLSGSDRDDNTKILNNVISGGYYGIQVYGGGSSSTLQETGMVIENNTINSFRYSGIYMQYMNAPAIRRNIITPLTNTGDQLIYMNDVSNDVVISYNKLSSSYPYTTGIYINNHQGTSSKKGMIFNNFISLADPYYHGINLISSNYTSIFFNSINLYGTASSSTSACIRFQSANNTDLRNNILSNKAGTYAIHANNVPTLSNYNDLYTSGTNIGFVGSNNYTTLSAWKSGVSRDANSVSVNPNFITDTDLHTTLISLDSAATPISGITDDIDKNTRNATRPDIGADEFNSLPNNLSILAVTNPVNGCEIDSQLLNVTVFNYGSNTQKNFPVRYRVNNGSVISQTFTDSILPGFSKTFTFTGKVNTKPVGDYNFIVWTDASAEQYRLNDTLKVKVTNYQVPDSVGIMIPSDSSKNLDFPFSLSWSPVNGATLYDIYIWPDSVNTRPPTAAYSGLTQISKQITTGLGYGQTYKWQIIARNPSCSTPGPVQRFTVRHLPDVLATTVNSPLTAFSGNSISVSWVTKNRGAGSTGSGYWYDLVYLSKDNILDGSDILLTGVINLTSLSASQSYTQSANVTLPNGISGIHHIIVRTDGYGYILESDEGNNNKSDSLGINVSLTPPPDLQVTSIIKPSQAFSGQTINVRYTVKNSGTGNTRGSSWYDHVYLHSDSVVGGTHVRSLQHTGALDPDSSYTVQTTVPLPNNISGGYYIIVRTDPYNAIYEHANENNNDRISDSLKVILTPPPDLIVRNIVIEDSVSNKEVVNLTYDLINQGGSATTNSWYDQAYVSKTTPFNANNSIYIGGWWRYNIGSDDTITCSQSVTIPDNITGSYFVYVFADAGNLQFEGVNDTNNISRKTTRVLNPDLIIYNVNVPASDTSGKLIQVNWKVRNDGLGKQIFSGRNDKIYISRHNKFHPDSVILLETVHYNAALNPGDSLLRTKFARIPDGTKGSRYVYVVADADNNIYENGKDTNNTRRSSVMTVHLAPYPDLRVLTVNRPDTSEAGKKASITYTVQNKGNRSAIPVWKDRVYMSKDSIYNPSKVTLLKTNNIASTLLVDSTYSITQDVDIPTALSAGNYYFYVFTDASDVRYEYLFENNNIKRSSKIFIKGYPPVDLTVTSITAPDSVFSGNNLSITWKVKNVGLAKTIANTWVDRTYLSSDSILDGSDRFVGETSIFTPLDKDSTYTRNLVYTTPNGISGTYYLLVKTDARNDNNDDDTSNNTRVARNGSGIAKTIKVILSLSSDLQITAWNVPSTATAGQPAQFIWKVENKGDTTTRAGSWTDRVYLSTDYTIDNSDINLGNGTRAGNLLKKASYTDTVSLFIPDITGAYIVLIKTDDGNREYEHNAENNNVQASVMTISQAPPGDLVVSSVTAPSSAIAGGYVNVSYQIRNRGSNPINGTRTDNIYISEDTIFDGTDVLFASRQDQSSLVPNATRNLSAGGYINGIKTGTHYFIVFTDVRDNINESRDTNNTGYGNAIDINVPVLPLNVLTNDTLHDDKNLYYRLIVPDSLKGESILITIKGDSVNGHNELYARLNEVPTRSNFDHAFSTPFYGNQEILIPAADTGIYYIMAYGNTSTANFQKVTLLARKLNFEIRKVTPVSVGNNGQVTLKIEGAKFTENTVFRIAIDSAFAGNPSTVDSSGVLYIEMNALDPSAQGGDAGLIVADPTVAYATFKLVQVPTGLYNVIAEKEEQTAMLRRGLKVVTTEPASVVIDVQRPSNSRTNVLNAFQINYRNTGNVDLVNSFLEIISNGGAPISLTQPGLTQKAINLKVILENDSGPAGVLRAGSEGSVMIYSISSTALGFTIILPNN